MLGTFEQEWKKILEEYSKKTVKDALFDVLSDSEASLVIFGTGGVGLKFAESLGSVSGRLKAFCDNHKTGFVERFDVPIITPTELLSNYQSAVIVVAASEYLNYNNQIYDQLIEAGVCKERIYRRYCGYDMLELEELEKHIAGYKWAYDFFEEEEEKRIILDRIRAYLFHHELDGTPPGEQYFDQNVIKLTEQEVFVDGGCYVGDTSLEFIKKVSGRYSYIYGFEPDETNYLRACTDLAGYENVLIVNKGLHDKVEMLSFRANGPSTTVGAKRHSTEILAEVQTISLDAFFSKENANQPTFIKLDIEGSEKNALVGAENTIRGALPKLAVSVYHKPEDIYEIPQLLKEYGDYSFKLRHYTKGVWETVLYAIPKCTEHGYV